MTRNRWTVRTAGCLILAGSCVIGFGSAGCGTSLYPSRAPASEPIILGSTVSDDGVASIGSFDAALAISAPRGSETLAIGELDFATDVDILDLGGVQAGDRVYFTVSSADTLDPAAALFDAAGHSLYVNDDRNYFSGDWDAHIELTVQHETEHLFAAIAPSAKSSTDGAYEVSVEIDEANAGASHPDAQVIYLDFTGAYDVVIGPRAPVDVPAFDAASISYRFTGDSEDMIREIVEGVRSDYVGFDVIILSSYEQDPPDTPHSTVYFGAYDPALLGVAENVDEYNERIEQPAIVFVDTFAAFEILQPSLHDMAQAIANVASHEIGHLIGLNHTRDPVELMDVTASLRQLMVDQAFSIAPLDTGVFPMGDQDAIQLIVDAVGGSESVAREASRLVISANEAANTTALRELPARDLLIFGTGCRGH